ncbi:copper chaperone PCu(A)C [Streptomyces sp. NPDC059850]|uniref:copper chaperone PCu(A)C n=1 Tax=Streptomyces sp. NPDC059850 TaxID=3346970 RepID=UPI003650A5E2
MITRHRAAAAAALALGLTGTLTACGDDGGGRPELSVGGAYIPRPAMSDMAAGFLTVTNKGGGEDKLTSITTPLARDVTLHTTKGTQMRQVGSLDVPANGELKLTSGGDHLMLTKLVHRPKLGEKVEFTLHFATSDPIKIKVPVEPMTYRPKD